MAERLTDAHVTLLLLLEDHPQEIISGSPGGPIGLTDEVITTLWPEAQAVVVPLRLALDRDGLIRDVGGGTYDGLVIHRWVVSDFGTQLLAHYKAIGIHEAAKRVRP